MVRLICLLSAVIFHITITLRPAALSQPPIMETMLMPRPILPAFITTGPCPAGTVGYTRVFIGTPTGLMPDAPGIRHKELNNTSGLHFPFPHRGHGFRSSTPSFQLSHLVHYVKPCCLRVEVGVCVPHVLLRYADVAVHVARAVLSGVIEQPVVGLLEI